MAGEIPYFDEQDVQSLLSGGGFGGLTKLLPLIFQQMSGMPVTLPGTIPEGGGYNYFDNYKAMLAIKDNAGSFSATRGIDSQAQEATLSIIAQRMAATFGRPLSREQMGAVRWAAGILSTYGPQYIGIAKKVLQQGGLSEDGNDQAINAMLGTAESLLDATYGSAGSRMPFYSVARASFGNDVASQEQDAILNEVVHRLFPVDADLRNTGGLNARETAGVLQHLNRMGINPLNTNTYAMQTLIRENAIAGTQNLSNAENERLIKTLTDSKVANVLGAGSRLDAKRAWVDQQSKNITGMTRDAARDYANQIDNANKITRQLKGLGFSTDLASANVEQLDAIGSNLSKQLLNLSQQIGNETDEDRKKELQTRQKYLDQVAKDFGAFRKASVAYQTAGGKVGDFEGQLERLQTEAVSSAVSANFKNISEDEQKTLARANIVRERLKNVKDLDLTLLESTREEDQQKKQEYLDELKRTTTNEAVLADIKEYVETKDKSGATLAESSAAVRKKMSDSLATDTSADANRIIKEYGEVLRTGNKDEIAKFENADENKEVIRQYKGVLAARHTEDVLGANARAVSKFQNAILATGGGSIGGQAIQGVEQVASAMDMITQMVGRYQMKDNEWEDYWARLSYGMTQSGTNINEIMQMSKIAADAATQVGGDRGLAAMAATELGIAAKATAKQMNYNPAQMSAVISQATGVASNSMTSRMINALAYSIEGKDFKKLKEKFKGDAKALGILQKIQNREALSSDEVHYIHNNGYQMLTDLGVTGSTQTSLLNRALRGEMGSYAIQGGATYALDDRTSKAIRHGVIGTQLKKVGITGEKMEAISDLAYDVLAKNPDLYNNPEKLKLAILDKMKSSGEYTDAEIKSVDALAEKLSGAVTDAATKEANRTYDGDLDKMWAAYNASKELAVTKQDIDNAGKLSELLPESAKGSLDAIIQAFSDPSSTLSNIIKAGMTGDFLSDDKLDEVSKKISLMGIAAGNTDVLRGQKVEDISTAKKAFNELTRRLRGDAKAAGEMLLGRQAILEKLSKVSDSKQREELIKLLDKEKKTGKDWEALKKAGLTDEDIKNIKNYDKTTRGIEKDELKTLNAVFTKGAESVKETVKAEKEKVTESSTSLQDEAAPTVSAAADNKPANVAGSEGSAPQADKAAVPADTKTVPAVKAPAREGGTGASSKPAADGSTGDAPSSTVVSTDSKLGSTPSNPVYIKYADPKEAIPGTTSA